EAGTDTGTGVERLAILHRPIHLITHRQRGGDAVGEADPPLPITVETGLVLLVDMGVHQAGHHGELGCVDEPATVVGARAVRGHRLDAVVPHDDVDVVTQPSTLTVPERPGVDDGATPRDIGPIRQRHVDVTGLAGGDV